MNSNPFYPHPALIVDIIAETDTETTYAVQTSMKPQVGQFVEVSLPTIGEAPISISGYSNGHLEITVRSAGQLTNKLRDLSVGQKLFIRGPYGNPFPLDTFHGKTLVIAAGGTGVAAVRWLLTYYAQTPAEQVACHVVLGFKTPDQVLFKRDIALWKAEHDLLMTVDKPDEHWQGLTGFVLTHLKDLPDFVRGDACALIVGPPAMMKYTAEEFQRLGYRDENLYLSFERHMSCGVGMCGHCKIDDKYVCIDGPVFDYPTAKRIID